MIEIRWEHDPAASPTERTPDDSTQALALLAAGNTAFASLQPDGDSSLVMPVTLEDLGFGGAPGMAPSQTPFAAILGCADARVPLELAFSQSANDLFVVRVAGNVLGGECVGSLDYALSHLPTVKAFAVVGHTSCGAVGASVDAYLDPTTYLGLSHNLPLRSIVDAIMAAVRGADRVLHAVHGGDVAARPGYRSALIDTSVILNAAVAADALNRIVGSDLDGSQSVAFGVFNLANRVVGLPSHDRPDHWRSGLVPPPSQGALPDFARQVAASPYVVALLNAQPAAAH